MTSIEQTVGIFTTDANLIISSWDAWLARATGISADEARGRALVELFPDLETRSMMARFYRVINEGTVEVLAPAFHHYLIACAPLEPSARFDRMQQRVTIAPLREAGSTVGCIVTIEDVTARLDRERSLSEQLASPDEQTRLQAARAIAEEEAIESKKLIDVIGDESWRVRRAAVDGLAKRAGTDEVKALLVSIKQEHRDPGVLNSALQVLALGGIDAVVPLTELLRDEDADVRIYATHALGDQQDRRVVPALLSALEDENLNVRYHAIEALGKLRAAEAVDALVAITESRDFFLTFPAIDSLISIGDTRIAPRIVPLLEDEMLRSPAADALGRLGDEEAVEPLASLLNKANAPAHVIAEALAALYDRYEKSYREGAHMADLARGHIKEAGVENLLAAIDEASGDELRALAIVLGWLDGEGVERALVRLLGQPVARKEVVESLVRYGERVTDLLIEQLKAEDVETRKAAIVALGRIGDSKAVPALVALLNEDHELVIPAAGALGKIGDRRAFDALLELIGDEEAAIRQAAIAAINSLGHLEMPRRAAALLADANPRVRESAAKIAGYFGYRECTEILLERCRDEDESVRRAAIEHIPFLEDGRVIITLVDALENETPRVRAAAASALGQVDSIDAMPHLLKALNDSDSWVRYFATKSIGHHADAESLDALARLAATDDARQVRIAAIDALGRVGGPRAVAALASIVESNESDLQRAAIASLGRIGHPDALPPLIEALRSTDKALRLESLKALGERGGEGVVEAIQWVAAAEGDSDISLSAINALARLATPEAISALVTLTADGDRREASVSALAQLGGKKIGLIGRGLAHPQSTVRRAVVDALGRMKRSAASELLIKALDDEDGSVRLAAVNALAHLGSRIAERRLVALMREDPDISVRRAAHRALGK